MALPTGWQWEYNGLLFGYGRDIDVLEVDGLDIPETRVSEVENPADHGSYVFGEFVGTRTVTIVGDVGLAGANLESALEDLRHALAPQPVPLPLRYQLPDGVTKRVMALPTKTDFPIDRAYSIGNPQWTAQFICGDPRIYEETERNATIVPLSAGSFGIVFNVQFSINFGGGISGSTNCDNIGSFSTLPRVRFYGPCSNPEIQNRTYQARLRCLIDVAAGDYLEVDFAAKTVMLNGVASRYYTLDRTISSWWALQPGPNEVLFLASGTSGGTTATVTWRGAWL